MHLFFPGRIYHPYRREAARKIWKSLSTTQALPQSPVSKADSDSSLREGAG